MMITKKEIKTEEAKGNLPKALHAAMTKIYEDMQRDHGDYFDIDRQDYFIGARRLLGVLRQRGLLKLQKVRHISVCGFRTPYCERKLGFGAEYVSNHPSTKPWAKPNVCPKCISEWRRIWE